MVLASPKFQLAAAAQVYEVPSNEMNFLDDVMSPRFATWGGSGKRVVARLTTLNAMGFSDLTQLEQCFSR